MNIAVVGANRGIGLQICKHYSSMGHSVYAFCRVSSPELLAVDCKVIEGVDVLDQVALKDRLNQLGAIQFDHLLHVAGILENNSLEDLDRNSIFKQFQVNALAPIETVKTFLSHLKMGATVGLLTSRMGSIADNGSGGSYGYRMSKAALNAGGKSLSLDLRPRGISVILIHPGWVQTDMTHNTGHLSASESAEGIVSLMQSKGMEQTGTFWHVDGQSLPW